MELSTQNLKKVFVFIAVYVLVYLLISFILMDFLWVNDMLSSIEGRGVFVMILAFSSCFAGVVNIFKE